MLHGNLLSQSIQTLWELSSEPHNFSLRNFGVYVPGPLVQPPEIDDDNTHGPAIGRNWQAKCWKVVAEKMLQRTIPLSPKSPNQLER